MNACVYNIRNCQCGNVDNIAVGLRYSFCQMQVNTNTIYLTPCAIILLRPQQNIAEVLQKYYWQQGT